MKTRGSILAILFVIVMAIAALGGGAFLMNSAAVAGASTQTAQAVAALPTETARPTATPIPPTVTASPTETPRLPTNTPQSTAASALSVGATQVSPKDGMVQMYVPAGEFLMGSMDPDSNASSDEKPQHTVYLDAFWIDQTEVTNAQYAKCVQAGQCLAPIQASSDTRNSYYGNAQYANYPVVYVSWDDAKNYCAWAGRRLPTEADWEKAARGTDGRFFPWGNQAPNTTLVNFNENVGDTTEVGKYPAGASPYGALDMAGNVSQWVSDWYGENYYQNSPERNPTGPGSGSYRVLRGGGFYASASDSRSSLRNNVPPGSMGFNIGFRCLAASP
jgi:formylglycine-generating enzyme required for sulfatase activity